MLRVVMTLLVKDEVDIIEDNVRFHDLNGVDAFLIMDNGSKDGTLDKLRDLQDSYEIKLVSNNSEDYKQSQWMTQLANTALKELDADYVISNDADEFWVPDENKKYSDLLQDRKSVVTVKKHNMIFTEDILKEDFNYKDMNYYVEKPLDYSKEEQQSGKNICMQLVPTSPKVIVDPRGLIRIKGGNHRAKHWKFYSRKVEAGIKVLHYPIRSYSKFEQNIKNREKLLRQNARMGPHYKRWVSFYKQGLLEEEFERMIIRNNELPTLERVGIIKKCKNKPGDFV